MSGDERIVLLKYCCSRVMVTSITYCLFVGGGISTHVKHDVFWWWVGTATVKQKLSIYLFWLRKSGI